MVKPQTLQSEASPPLKVQLVLILAMRNRGDSRDDDNARHGDGETTRQIYIERALAGTIDPPGLVGQSVDRAERERALLLGLYHFR